MTIYLLLTAFIIMLASLAGVFFVWRGFNGVLKKNATYLMTFAIGVFSVVVYSLVEETLHLGTSGAVVGVSLIGGALFLEMILRLVPHAHHHHDAPHDDHDHSRLDARRLLIGDAIHNIGDGILLVPAFLVDVRLGIATAVGIFLHELVQEISEFFVLREAGYSVREALIYNFLVSSTILIGISISLSFVHAQEFVGPLLAFAAGGFLYVILRDLIPHVLRASKRGAHKSTYFWSLLAGILLMISVNIAVPHTHEGVSTLETLKSHQEHSE